MNSLQSPHSEEQRDEAKEKLEELLRTLQYVKRQMKPSPRFKAGKRKGSIELEDDSIALRAKLADVLGTSDTNLSNQLISQLRAATGCTESSVDPLNAALTVLGGVKPRDELEGQLAAQMVSVHNLAMKEMGIAACPGQHDPAKDASITRSTQLMKIFTMQMEALNRYRTKGEQKVSVKHVHVHNGGKAIVGNVNHGNAVERGARGYGKK